MYTNLFLASYCFHDATPLRGSDRGFLGSGCFWSELITDHLVINKELSIQINCDLGECLTPDPDATVMPLTDIANIACGGHAGDDASMNKAIILARQNGVKIGVHPGYPDRINFGRIPYPLSEKELFALISHQVSHFQELCRDNKVTLEYIKPHGALYHQMTADSSVLRIICQAIKATDSDLILIVPVGANSQEVTTIAVNEHIRLIYEMFADRGYNGSQLIARGKKGAVLDNPQAIIKQYRRWVHEPSLPIDTICFHSDNPSSVEALQLLRA